MLNKNFVCDRLGQDWGTTPEEEEVYEEEVYWNVAAKGWIGSLQ